MPRCKVCKTPTTQRFGLTYACGFDHAIEYAQRNVRKKQQAAQRKAEREEKRRHREQKETVRPLKWYQDRAKEACHAYIRARDEKEPCISCRRYHTGQYHAGHYRPSGVNSALRYDERNIHKQCSACNEHLSGNLTPYRRSLIQKLGEETVCELEQNNEVKRWGKDELIEIRKHYQQKLKELRQ